MSSGADIIVPILRAGALAREFCRRVAAAQVESVFERSFYLGSEDIFICVGEPAIGNGPLTLIAELDCRLPRPTLGLYPGQPAVVSRHRIAIGGKVTLTFDGCVLWRQPPWPAAVDARELHELGRVLADRVLRESPSEGFGRILHTPEHGSCEGPLARIARPRIARFASWLRSALEIGPVELAGKRIARSTSPGLRGEVASTAATLAAVRAGEGGPLRAEHIGGPPHPARRLASSAARRPLPASRERWSRRNMRAISHGPTDALSPVADLVGLGPGLTPSGDDFLVGALALLDALDEGPAHAALARAIAALPRGLTSPLSECLLRAAASRHVGEHLCCAVAAVVSGLPDQAIAAIRKIGHCSGWDMMVGILTALGAVVARSVQAEMAEFVTRGRLGMTEQGSSSRKHLRDL